MKDSWKGSRLRAVLQSAMANLPWLVAVLMMAGLAIGQERFGEINGVATDATGAVLPNVNVVIKNMETERSYTTRTVSDGTYGIRDLVPGRYIVTFELTGFSRYEVPNISLAAGKVLKVDGKMTVGGTQQSVQVTEAAPLIDTSTTMVAHNVTAEEFDRLPKSRTFQSLALTAPNVNSGTVEGGYQVNGASGAENQFVVDGISTNSIMEGHSRQNAAFEILQEVQVKTAGIEAQYGGALGGVISAITKSGGNKFHGDIHYYYYGSKTEAGPVKRLFMDPVDITTVTYQQDYKNPYSNHEAGYAIGGPILKDKLYFFSAASPRFQSREASYLTSDLKQVKVTSDTQFWQAYNKLSWDIRPNLRANFAHLWTPSSQQGVLPAYTGYGNASVSSASSVLANQIRGSFSPQSNYNGNVDWNATPTTMVSVRASRFWDNYKSLGVPGISAVEWAVPSTGLSFVPADLQHAQNFQSTPRVQNTDHDLATRTMGQVDVSKFLTFGGTHDIKVGAGRIKNVNNVENAYPGGGYVSLYWDREFQNPVTKQFQRGKYGYYTIDDIGTKGSTGGTIDNIYFQDRYRPTRRLSLDLGLRLEKEVVPSFRRDIRDYAFEFGWGEKIAPRLGASYDVLGDGRWKVYGSYGIFYDWVKYELARGTFGGDVWRTSYYALDTLDVLSLSGTNHPGTSLYPGGFEDHRRPSFGKDTLDPNIKPMSSDLTSAGTEFQLNNNTVLAVRYTRNHLRNAIEDVGTLDENGNEVYIYGNPGSGLTTKMSPTGKTAPFVAPKPTRTYNAVDFTISRRFANRWFGSASYVYSRLRGNYSGIASSDEITPPGTGRVTTVSQQLSGQAFRPGTSASRYYDADVILWDSKGNLDVTGPLATDRPHVFKLYGTYILPFGTEIGGFFYGGSGTPVTTYVSTQQNVPMMVNGRGDMGRTPFLTQTDLVLAHEVKLGEVKRLRFEFNAQNLFNQKTSRLTYNYLNRYRIRTSGVDMTGVDLAKGYDWQALLMQTADAKLATGYKDPRFGRQDLFNTGFAGRLGVKFIF